MVQYSNRAKTCHQSEKGGTTLKQCENLSQVRKRWCNTHTVPKPNNIQKKLVQFSNRIKFSPVRKRWYNTQSGSKPVTSQKKMVQFSNRTNLSPVTKRWYNTQTKPKPVTSQKKDGTILKQCQNLSRVRKW